MALAMGGKGGGSLWGGAGVKTKPLKNPPKGNPKLMLTGKPDAFANQGKVSKEFEKYAKMGLKPSKFAPNTKVEGTRNASNAELVQQYNGDPEQGVRSSTPYYEIYAQQKRAAESPVNKEQIPAAYREQVKRYFENIKP